MINKYRTFLSTLILFLFGFLYFYNLNSDFYVGDTSHLTLNSSYNFSKGLGYTWGNINNLTSALKMSPLISIFLGFIFYIFEFFTKVDLLMMIEISSFLIVVFTTLSLVTFFDTLKLLTNKRIAAICSFLFFSNFYILNVFLKISGEALGFFLVSFWINQLLKFQLNSKFNNFLFAVIANSLFYAAKYQLLFLHLYGILLILYICKKKSFFLVYALLPTSLLTGHFYINYLRTNSIFGHPAGVSGDSFSILFSDFIILLKRLFLIPNLPYNNYIILVVVVSTIYSIFKSKLIENINFYSFLIPKFTFNYLAIFACGNIILLFLTLRLNKVDSLSFRYFIFNLFFVFLVISMIGVKSRILLAYITFIAFFNISQLFINYETDYTIDECYCSDLSIETISYIEKNLTNENIIGSRFSTQIYYSEYKGLVFQLPFYSDYNKKYGRTLYLNEENFLSVVSDNEIRYVVFFEGSDKKDYFVENNLYGEFINNLYNGTSIYVKNTLNLKDGKIIEISY